VQYIQRSLKDPDRPNDLVFYKKYDVVHLSYPFHLWKLRWAFKSDFLVLHWHGSDARNYFAGWPVKKFLRDRTSLSLLATIDLNYWIPEGKHFLGCVDTSVFKPMPEIKKSDRVLEWGKGFPSPRLPHSQVPEFLNGFKEAIVQPRGVSRKLVSVSALEAAACGLRVRDHSYMTRKWVEDNASVDVAAKRLLGVYEEELGVVL